MRRGWAKKATTSRDGCSSHRSRKDHFCYFYSLGSTTYFYPAGLISLGYRTGLVLQLFAPQKSHRFKCDILIVQLVSQSNIKRNFQVNHVSVESFQHRTCEPCALRVLCLYKANTCHPLEKPSKIKTVDGLSTGQIQQSICVHPFAIEKQEEEAAKLIHYLERHEKKKALPPFSALTGLFLPFVTAAGFPLLSAVFLPNEVKGSVDEVLIRFTV